MKPDDASPVSLLPSQPHSAEASPERMRLRGHTLRNGLFCALIFAACFWISWPVAQMGFVDDFSYIKSAQVFARTGHLVFNGWATAMLGWQVLWGALFIRLFGFSFMTVKLSTLPLAMASVFLFYVIEVRFRIQPRNAALGSLALGLSPLFLPLAASFMSDIPGLFVILLCLYCCQRAAAARTSAAAITWLSVAAASNLAGGTVRQIAWLGALVMVPATAWLLRKRRGVLVAGSLLWAGAIAGVLYCMHWFAIQPGSVPQSLFAAPLKSLPHPVFTALLYIAGDFLCLLLVVFPVMAAWLPGLRAARGASLPAAATILLLFLLLQIVGNWTLPWIPHLLVSEFSVANVAQMSPYRGPLIFPESACLLFSLLTAAAFLAAAASARAWLRASRPMLRSAVSRPMFWLLVPFSLAYCGLLLQHAFQQGGDFDRYLLGLMPFALIALIRLYELRIAARLPAISVVTVALYALLAIAGTHDWFAWQRARLTAIAELRSAGIPRTQIQGGFEYDGWTQIETDGHIQAPGVIPASGAAPPDPRLASLAPACRLDTARLTPAVRPQFTVAFPPEPCLSPAGFAPVPYLTWLPPFHRTIQIQQFPAASISAR